MKVVVVTNTDDHVIRMIDGSTSPLTEISLLSRRVLEFRDPADYITRVIISCDDPRNIRKAELPRCSNLCGKITHVATKDIYNPGIRPYIRRTKNLFGLFTCVYSKYANFHTGAAMSSTLFRGGNRTADIKRAIEHIFIECYVDKIIVHNCVFTGNLGVPVSRNNSAVQKSIEEELQCRAEIIVCLCDENMFAISCLLKSFKTPLLEVGSGDSEVSGVRVNICRTGVLNIFIAIPGGIDARLHLDETLAPLAHRIFNAIARVV
jgi:hypothetical protein